MAEKREHQRITCAEKCLLYVADSQYYGAVTNISLSGALVTLGRLTPDIITRGDACSLVLSNDPATSFFRYRSRIARVNRTEIGLEILEHEF